MSYHSDIIQELNRRVASMLHKECKECHVTFVPLIKREEYLKDGGITQKETLGQCNTGTGEIKIVPKGNWGVTLIEELVHLYEPEKKHPQVKSLVKQCVRYLKLTNTPPATKEND